MKDVTIENEKGNEIKGSLSTNDDKESFNFKPSDSQSLKGTTVIAHIKAEVKEDADVSKIPNVGEMTYHKENEEIGSDKTNKVVLTLKDTQNTPIDKEIEKLKESQEKEIKKQNIQPTDKTEQQPYVLPQTGGNSHQSILERLFK